LASTIGRLACHLWMFQISAWCSAGIWLLAEGLRIWWRRWRRACAWHGLPGRGICLCELLRPEAQWLVSEVPDALLAQWVPTHFNALAAMLWEFRAADHAAIRCLAQAIAAACHGERHLWQDMGFAARDELSALIAQCFPRLHALNAANLKWKRFLFALLGERLGIGGGGLIPPACPRCSSYRSCYPA